jgi:pimeloyl-ACP methyl ester carboxylesterase
MARAFETEGMKAVAGPYAKEAQRIQLLRKDPRSYQQYYEEFALHSATGAALTARGIMLKRPPISALEPKLKELTIPTLIMVGDEDDRCIDPALFMKRTIPHCGLAVFPQSGHVINVEEPALFNQIVLDFLTLVEAGAWA